MFVSWTRSLDGAQERKTTCQVCSTSAFWGNGHPPSSPTAAFGRSQPLNKTQATQVPAGISRANESMDLEISVNMNSHGGLNSAVSSMKGLRQYETSLALFGGYPVVPAGRVTPGPAANRKHLKALASVVESGKYHRVNHPTVNELENRHPEWSGNWSVRTVGSGTAALDRMFYVSEIAPPNNAEVMTLYAAAVNKVWAALPNLTWNNPEIVAAA